MQTRDPNRAQESPDGTQKPQKSAVFSHVVQEV